MTVGVTVNEVTSVTVVIMTVGVIVREASQ